MKRIGFIIFVFVLAVPALALATDVGGIIDTDTTWTLANSPYNFTSTVQIAEGVTLTIEPGVEVNKGTIETWGSIHAVGTNRSNIHFNAVTLLTKEYNPSVEIEFSVFSDDPYLAQIYARNLHLRNSVLYGTDVYIRGSNSYVEKNIFVDSRLIHQHTRAENVFIRNNNFHQPRNYHSIFVNMNLSYTQPVIQYNSFLNNSIVHFELRNSGGNCPATDNFWDTTDPAVIDSMIMDRNDDLNIIGYVMYDPFLTAPHPDTPPNASFEASATVGRPPLTVNFTDQSILAITSWEWDFGDGSTSTEQNPSHTYTDTGKYTVSLTVTDILGLQDTYTDTITVSTAMPGIPLLLLED